MICEKKVCTINGHYMGLLPFSISAELDVGFLSSANFIIPYILVAQRFC